MQQFLGIIMALAFACCLPTASAFEEERGEERGERMELVPMEQIKELFKPYRPSLTERAQDWMAANPELAPRIHEHLSDLYREVGEELRHMEHEIAEREHGERREREERGEREEHEEGKAREEAAMMRREIITALSLVELEMSVDLNSHLAEQARGPERDKLIKQLRRDLNTLFDHKLEQREREIRELEMELAEIREQVTHAKDQREAIINRRLAEIGSGPDVFEW